MALSSPADDPIVMYSLPDSHSESPNGNNEENSENEAETTKDDEEMAKNDEEMTKIRSDSSSEEEKQEKASDLEENSDKGKERLVRMLPASFCNLKEDERIRGGGVEKDSIKDLPKCLKDVIDVFSGDFDVEKYASMDILEIAKMKGIVFENPPWWPDEGFLEIIN